jgi:hypothetical protein
MAESATSVGSLTFLGLFAMLSLSPHFTFTRRSFRGVLPEFAIFPCKLEPVNGAKARP